MKRVAKCAVFASFVILAAGTSAWAQGYPGNAVQNQLQRYGYTDIHNLRPMQGWSADAMENGQMVHIIVGENGLIATFRGVEQGALSSGAAADRALRRYGYTDIQNLKPDQGWSADASKSGQMVHIVVSGDGRIATFRGIAPEAAMQGSSGPFVENSGAGYNRSINYGFLAARDELSRYGYTDINNLRPMPGWSADASKNGRNIHVELSNSGLVATYSGR